MSSKHAPIKSVHYVTISLNSRIYQNTWLELTENLCGEILIGLDFQKLHTVVTFLHSKTESELRVNELKTKVCSLPASNLLVPILFASLKLDIWPFVTKFCEADQQFTAQKVEHLLAEVIKLSSSHWKVQVAIMKHEFSHHKKHVIRLFQYCQHIYKTGCLPLTKNRNPCK